jgi:hypothetical protein
VERWLNYIMIVQERSNKGTLEDWVSRSGKKGRDKEGIVEAGDAD